MTIARRRLATVKAGLLTGMACRRLRRGLAEWVSPSPRPPAVVILMPGAVHIGDLALSCLRGSVTIIAIANGLADDEFASVRRLHPEVRHVRVARTLQHWDVIDSLLAAMPGPFWLVDHDCYVLDPQSLDAASATLGRVAGVAFYAAATPDPRFRVPETFLMLLNPQVLNPLMVRYDIRSRPYEWEQLPDGVKQRFMSAGLSRTFVPEPHKGYFDTLRVVALLAELDGRGFDTTRGYSGVCQPYPEVIHIGHTSHPQFIPQDRYRAAGAYFFHRRLDEYADEALANAYRGAASTDLSADEMRSSILASGNGMTHELLSLLDDLASAKPGNVAC